jgi:uncharacterized protein (TIGR03083 family)
MSYDDRAATTDCGQVYESLRQDLVAIVRTVGPDDLERTVPASPEWRVRDVLAHVAGLTADLNGGDIGPGDPDAWTRVQVERFRASTIDDVVAAWDREARTFEDGLRLFGYQVGNHFVGDLFIHLTDVQAALGRPVDRDGTAMWIALDWYLDSLHGDVRDGAPGALETITAPERRVVGAGAVVATVTTSPFELLRACAGRRSAAQIDEFGWAGDVAWFAPRLSRYSVPTVDLTD